MGLGLNGMRIDMRLGVGFGILLMLLCAVGGFATWQASRINANTVEIADNWLAGVHTLGSARTAANGVRRASLRAVLESDAAKKQTQRAEHDVQLKRYDQAMGAYEKIVSGAEETALAQRIKSAWADYLAVDKQLLELSDANNDAAARTLATGESSATFQALNEAIENDVAFQNKGSEEARNSAESTYEAALWTTVALIVIAGVMGVGMAVFITRSITRPLNQAVNVAETVANGDLTSQIDVAGRDETAQLLGALRNMNGNLASLISQVRHGGESIATGASQIAAGNTDLSARTEEQAASLEETASSMEELTATVRQNAESAKQGNMLAANASEVAVRGGDVVGRVVNTMQEIADSSIKVADIIGTIESIAFQTNILALNAAVEAARAGEQGRGFAVVAGEVRALAQRSATAAKEIKDLINESVNRVRTGTAQVDEAGRTIDEVVSAVRRMTDLMGEIAAASEEQHRGIEQVNQAVVQMDQVTQQNAALVEEASAAAQSMADQALGLRDAVSVFKVSGTQVAAARTAVPAGQTPRRAVTSKSTARPAKTAAFQRSSSAVAAHGKPAVVEAQQVLVAGAAGAPGKSTVADAPKSPLLTAAVAHDSASDWETF
ncbi:MAG: methyl-accepting chemotaxis protein [Paraburkholderia sp.]|uniref:methyl-accepting chemotaxis protein n=1 Tax=Paraburkholderia sp. TaxID=1926495 RepID=UPI00120FA72D|nr:methyl-accepting chemotaxis protein [Paraburkholderia sp.]TAM03148.1 MAG: methyl-accepting chemotaxis protein [Paraburkholderia sp.]